MPKHSTRWHAAGVSAGLAAIWAFKIVQFRRTAGATLDIPNPPAAGTPHFARLLETLTQAPLREGNRIEILRNGCQIFPSLLEEINAAQETICLSTYIFWAGGAAEDIAKALATRAMEGLEVKILLDAWGSAKLDNLVVEMWKQAGAEVVWFRPVRGYQFHKMNHRMHRRIVVMDGKIAFVGGVGIAEQWEGDADDPDHWRETHVRIEGPAVRDALGGFIENWAEATGALLTGRHLPDLQPFDNGVPVLITRSSPHGGSEATEELFFAAILGARRRLWITTCYFAPRAGFIHALCDAARRGVDVRILVNGREIDKEVVRKAGQRSYGKLLEAGVRIYEYQKARLHAKVILVDDDWANVGSANFDNRSFALEEEINVSIYDGSLVSQLAEHFREDVAVSDEMSLQVWQARPVSVRLAELAAEVVRQSL